MRVDLTKHGDIFELPAFDVPDLASFYVERDRLLTKFRARLETGSQDVATCLRELRALFRAVAGIAIARDFPLGEIQVSARYWASTAVVLPKRLHIPRDLRDRDGWGLFRYPEQDLVDVLSAALALSRAELTTTQVDRIDRVGFTRTATALRTRMVAMAPTSSLGSGSVDRITAAAADLRRPAAPSVALRADPTYLTLRSRISRCLHSPNTTIQLQQNELKLLATFRNSAFRSRRWAAEMVTESDGRSFLQVGSLLRLVQGRHETGQQEVDFHYPGSRDRGHHRGGPHDARHETTRLNPRRHETGAS